MTMVSVSLRSGEVTAIPHAGDPRPERPNWQDYANCTGEDPDVFFPPDKRNASEAKAICAECVVRVECAEYALSANEQHGVWGGLTVRDRRKIRKVRYRAMVASASGASASVPDVVPSVARWSRPAPPASQAPRATHT